MRILHRYHLIPALTFLVGTAVGSIVTGSYGESLESADEAVRQSIAATQDGPVADATGGPSEDRESPASALSATADESRPTGTDPADLHQDLEAKLLAMSTGWSRLQAEVEGLQQRVDGLEKRLAAAPGTPEATGAATARPRPNTPEDRRTALVKAGLAEDRAREIVWRQGQQELDRLYFRDIAIREGWFGTDRYREELGRIQENAFDLRDEIGDDYYDRYLFASGQSNRVEIISIIAGSTAENADLLPGDLVEAYGDSRIFTYGDLRSATTEGDRDELVPVQIRRDDDILEIWLPRGPMGVRLDRASMDPEA